jgi:hypothetical protein
MMSLAVLTPLMLMRTAESGGQNQGVGHQQVYLWQLNAILGDFAEYINRYILAPMARINFGANVATPRIKFRKLGVAQQETLRAIVQSLLGAGKIKVDTDELGAHIGLDIEEIEELSKPLEEPSEDPEGDEGVDDNGNRDKRVGRPERLKDDDQKNVTDPKRVTKQITQRVAQQAQKAFTNKTWGRDWLPSLGYRRQLAAALEASGVEAPEDAASAYGQMVMALTEDCVDTNYYSAPEEFVRDFERISDVVLETVIDNG